MSPLQRLKCRVGRFTYFRRSKYDICDYHHHYYSQTHNSQHKHKILKNAKTSPCSL